jgi:protein phosphatase
VTAALGLLVVLLLGGGYGFWRYNQGQYYVGEQGGFVAIFRGTDQSLAGISMSSLVQHTKLPVSQLTTTDQTTVAATISQGSVGSAQQVVQSLSDHASSCHEQWQALAAWQAKYAAYQVELANAARTKSKTKPQDNAGVEPPLADPDCAPAAAFGILASALPTAQPGTPPASPSTSPSKSPATAHSSTPTKSPSPAAA